MKGRYIKQIITTLRDGDIEKREQLINDAISALQSEGKKVVSLQTQHYSVATSVPQYLMTDIIYEEDDKQESKKQAYKARFIKQVLTRLPEKDMEFREDAVNSLSQKISDTGAKIIHFNTAPFGLTKMLTPMWMVTDILYEADKPFTEEKTNVAESAPKDSESLDAVFTDGQNTETASS